MARVFAGLTDVRRAIADPRGAATGCARDVVEVLGGGASCLTTDPTLITGPAGQTKIKALSDRVVVTI